MGVDIINSHFSLINFKKSMKKFILLYIFPLFSFAQLTTNPNTIEIDQSVTITIDINSSETDCNGMNSPKKFIYILELEMILILGVIM